MDNELVTLLSTTRAQLVSKDVHDEDFLAFRDALCFPERPLVLMDVGANRGQSIASFLALKPDAHVHAFEANPRMMPVLRGVVGFNSRQITLHEFGLSEDSAELVLHVPCFDGKAFYEEATVDLEQFEKPWVKEKFATRGKFSIEQVRVPLMAGDTLKLVPDVIKIDVEGAELSVLKGLEQTISRHKPVLLIENSDFHNVTAWLQAHGYAPYRWLDGRFVPFFGETTNTFYMHAEMQHLNQESCGVDMNQKVEEVAGQYSEKSDFEYHSAECKDAFSLMEYLSVRYPSGGKILDVGAGQGMHAGFLQREGCDVYCADVIRYMSLYEGQFQGLLQQKYQRNGYAFDLNRLHLFETDAMQLLFRDNFFDAVFSFNAFEHIPDPQRAFKEVVRVLKPGGIAYISFDPVWTCDTGNHFSHYVSAPWAHLVLDTSEFRNQMRAAGATPDEIAEYPDAMNGHREIYYRNAVADLDSAKVEILHEDCYREFSNSTNQQHPNFKRALELGYSEQELRLRRLRWVLKKL